MRSICLFLGFLILFPAPAQAIGLSLMAGANVTQKSSEMNGQSGSTDGLLNFGGGLLLTFSKVHWLGFETGALYFQRGIGYSDGVEAYSGWVGIPAVVKIKTGGFFFGGGGYLARGVGQVNVKTGGVSSSTDFGSAGLKFWDYGATVAVGYEATPVIIEGRFNKGLANVAVVDGTTSKFTDFQLLIGLQF